MRRIECRSWMVLGLLVPAAIAAGEVPQDSPVREALERADKSVAKIVAVPDGKRTFDNTLGALDDLIAQLELDTSMTAFLSYVSTDASQRDAGQLAEEHILNWTIDLEKREDLYRAVKAYADTKPALKGEQKRALEHALRDFRRAGMALDPKVREELKGIEKEITRLGIAFEKNIRDDETRVALTRQELSGLPDDWFQGIERTGDLYLVGMSYPQFEPIMDFCDNETTRHKMWVAFKRRGGKENVRVLEQMLKLRAQAARLLGYATPADYETEIRMTKDARTVQAFYDKLRPLVRRKALQDREALLAAKRSYTGDPDAKLYPWDTSFYLNILRKTKYSVDPQLVREYFPLDRVIQGLFSVTQSLYGLEYRDVTRSQPSLWHADVQVYEVYDRASKKLLGKFYLDLYPRDNKFSHAAQWGLAQHKVWADGHETLPVAALVCNFTKPTADKPSLLTHDEVETFFHEFGHCLHTILSESRYYQFGGTNVERDFVEAPSQMFENWVWDAAVLQTFARHYRTNEPFPDALVEGLLAARNLGSGMLAERQIYYGLFDMKCHTAPNGEVNTTKLAADLWDPAGESVELYDPIPEVYFQAAFGHLNGYQAGYYGYQWSLVYACDMFQRFKEKGMLSPEAGDYYRRNILARGGTADGLDLVKGYLGREPTMEPYLRHLGLQP